MVDILAGLPDNVSMGHYDYIESGNLFNSSLTHFLSGEDVSCYIGHALRTWHCGDVHGIIMDPIKHALNRLPCLPNTLKLDKRLGKSDILEIYEGALVESISFQTLCERYRVRSVDIFKIACRGTIDVLEDLLEYCDFVPSCYPRILAIDARFYSEDHDYFAFRN